MNDDLLRKLNTCIQCGTCIASCFSGRVTALNTRKIIMEYIAKGRPVKDDDTIWFCVTCYACQERCPRGIPITDTILEARKELVREKGLPGRLKYAFKFLMEQTAYVPAREEHVKLREEFGLPLYHSQFVDEAREEVSEIVRRHIGGVVR
ncbi:CoB--CoM heterodisulfide reductase subunit C [Geoglobus ahangari]|uniref:CoB--CoM heterodisulfide reductase subunit C n=1 Tax=Geoglobus ahangari TaxID=113653 RepID=A0A0F7IF10_9EURY|nr:4Fe-4S dicluster domain-containing protein [Geoglobus ahangari]AKG91012.1 CoB--CoM heterodisulfide reductase subunit C [Geoglobus ahangari]NOY11467.1 4Fe-4S dicluster domain-containing protein [Archaeoglobi archaeon]